MTATIYRGVRFNIITVDAFWRVTVGGKTLDERWHTYSAAYNYAVDYIDLHYEELK